MKIRNKWLKTEGVLLVSIGVVLVSGILAAKYVNRTIATVNGKIILQSEFEEKVKTIIGDKGMQGTIAADKINEVKEQILDEMINELLILQEAETKKIRISEKEIEGGIETLKKGFENPADFEKELVNKGITIDKLKIEVKKQLTANKLFEKEVMPKVVQPTKEDIDKFYQENRDEVQKLLSEYIYRRNVDTAKTKWLKKIRDRASVIKNDIE